MKLGIVSDEVSQDLKIASEWAKDCLLYTSRCV